MYEHIPVGETIFRPLEQRNNGWTMVCEMPEAVAMAWMQESTPKAAISGYHNVTVESIASGEHATYGWFDKLAVVVATHLFTDLAVYKADGKVYLLQQRTDRK
jgi:hypothetical protein